MTLALSYFYLGLSIVFEVVGTSALKESQSFTRLLPSLITVGAYVASFLLFSLTLRTIPVGIAYAIWAGLGIVLIAVIGWLWFKQPLDAPAGRELHRRQVLAHAAEVLVEPALLQPQAADLGLGLAGLTLDPR